MPKSFYLFQYKRNSTRNFIIKKLKTDADAELSKACITLINPLVNLEWFVVVETCMSPFCIFEESGN